MKKITPSQTQFSPPPRGSSDIYCPYALFAKVVALFKELDYIFKEFHSKSTKWCVYFRGNVADMMAAASDHRQQNQGQSAVLVDDPDVWTH